MVECSVSSHCRQIDRLNQRGGRMLSIIDLLEAGTLDLEVAAFLLAAVSRGASFLVGARPGGAGKTTVMGALLNFLPADVPIVAATEEAVAAAPANRVRTCYVCHEIGRGPYFAYLWGAAARDYFALHRAGHILATNLHADTLPQCHAQLCGDNAVPESDFRRVHLMIFLGLSGGGIRLRRRLAAVYVTDGQSPHVLLFRDSGRHWEQVAPSPLALPGTVLADARSLLSTLAASGLRTIQEVRSAVVKWQRPDRAASRRSSADDADGPR